MLVTYPTGPHRLTGTLQYRPNGFRPDGQSATGHFNMLLRIMTTLVLMQILFYFYLKKTYYKNFKFIIVFCVSPVTCLHALMFKKLFIFLILPGGGLTGWCQVDNEAIAHNADLAKKAATLHVLRHNTDI